MHMVFCVAVKETKGEPTQMTTNTQTTVSDYNSCSFSSLIVRCFDCSWMGGGGQLRMQNERTKWECLAWAESVWRENKRTRSTYTPTTRSITHLTTEYISSLAAFVVVHLIVSNLKVLFLALALSPFLFVCNKLHLLWLHTENYARHFCVCQCSFQLQHFPGPFECPFRERESEREKRKKKENNCLLMGFFSRSFSFCFICK